MRALPPYPTIIPPRSPFRVHPTMRHKTPAAELNFADEAAKVEEPEPKFNTVPLVADQDPLVPSLLLPSSKTTSSSSSSSSSTEDGVAEVSAEKGGIHVMCTSNGSP